MFWCRSRATTTLKHGTSVHRPLVAGSSSIPSEVGALPGEKDDVMDQNCLRNLRFLEIASLCLGGLWSLVVGPVVLKAESLMRFKAA